MAQVKDDKGNVYEVPDVDAVDIARNDPKYQVVGDVPVSDGVEEGGQKVASDPSADVSTPGEQSRYYHQKYEEEQHDTVGSRARSLFGGLGHELSLGFANPWKDDQEFNPGYSTVGKAGGIVATLLIPGAGEENLARGGAGALADAAAAGSSVAEGSKLMSAGRYLADAPGRLIRGAQESTIGQAIGATAGVTPLGYLTRGASWVGGRLVPGAGWAHNIGQMTAEGAANMGGIGFGNELSHQITDDNANLNGEALLGATLGGLGEGAGFGALAGGAAEGLGLLGLGAEKVLLRNPKIAEAEYQRAIGRDSIDLHPDYGIANRGYDEWAKASEHGAPSEHAYEHLTETSPHGPGPATSTKTVGEFIGSEVAPGVSVLDGVTSRMKSLEVLGRRLESLSEAPALAEKMGVSRQSLAEFQGSLQRELNGLRSFSKNGTGVGHTADALAGEAPRLERLARDMHANDRAAVQLHFQGVEGIPKVWSKPELRDNVLQLRDYALHDIEVRRAGGQAVSRAEEDAARIKAQLSGGRALQPSAKSPIEAPRSPGGAPAPKGVGAKLRSKMVDKLESKISSKVPGLGFVKKAAKYGLGPAATVAATELAIRHGVGALLHGGLAAGAAVAGGAASAALLRGLLRDPHVGGILSAGAASIFNSSVRSGGSKPAHSTDARQALRELGARARSVTPQAVSAHTVGALSHIAGQAPLSVSQAGQTAGNRHAMLLALLDRVDPMVTSPSGMLHRPLPSSAAVHEVAGFMRMAADPRNFLVAALDGRLTPEMMANAEKFWPATVQRARAELLQEMSSPGADVSQLPAARRRNVELLLGPAALGGTSSADDYRAGMVASVARGDQARQQGIGSPKAPAPMGGDIADSPLSTPTIRASRPATK